MVHTTPNSPRAVSGNAWAAENGRAPSVMDDFMRRPVG
jgi:hypothetical protein